jgi:hypothetical protein
MPKSSSVKKVPRKKVRVSRKRPNMGYGLFMTGLVALGSFLVVISREDRTSAEDAPGVAIGEHWHAYLGINICGEWLPNVPPYEAATGVHSHGDGFIHLHPLSSSGAHDRATVGLFMKQAPGDWEFKDDEIKVDGRDRVKNGDKCETGEYKGKKGVLRWSVDQTEKAEGANPSRYIPEDGDVIAITFLPEDVETLPTPPGAQSTPTDLSPTDPAASTTTTVPADGATTTTTPESSVTTTTVAGATTTTAPAATTTTQ